MKSYTIYSINFHTGEKIDEITFTGNSIQAAKSLAEYNSISANAYYKHVTSEMVQKNPRYKNKGIHDLRKIYNNAHSDKLDWPVYRMRVEVVK